MHVHFCIQLFSFLQQCQKCQQFSRWRPKFPLPPQTLYCTYIIVKLSLFTFNTDNTFSQEKLNNIRISNLTEELDLVYIMWGRPFQTPFHPQRKGKSKHDYLPL